MTIKEAPKWYSFHLRNGYHLERTDFKLEILDRDNGVVATFTRPSTSRDWPKFVEDCFWKLGLTLTNYDLPVIFKKF